MEKIIEVSRGENSINEWYTEKIRKGHKMIVYCLAQCLEVQDKRVIYSQGRFFEFSDLMSSFWRSGLVKFITPDFVCLAILKHYAERGYIVLSENELLYTPTKKLAVAYWGRAYIKEWEYQL